MELLLGDGEPLPVGAVHHQDDELKEGREVKRRLALAVFIFYKILTRLKDYRQGYRFSSRITLSISDKTSPAC